MSRMHVLLRLSPIAQVVDEYILRLGPLASESILLQRNKASLYGLMVVDLW